MWKCYVYYTQTDSHQGCSCNESENNLANPISRLNGGCHNIPLTNLYRIVNRKGNWLLNTAAPKFVQHSVQLGT